MAQITLGECFEYAFQNNPPFALKLMKLRMIENEFLRQSLVKIGLKANSRVNKQLEAIPVSDRHLKLSARPANRNV